MKMLQGSWETSAKEKVVIRENHYEGVSANSGMTHSVQTIEETDYDIKLQNWVLNKDSQQIAWRNVTNGKTVEWFRTREVKIKTLMFSSVFSMFENFLRSNNSYPLCDPGKVKRPRVN